MSRLRSDERGFTIIEVMVASLLLIIGLFGVVTMVDAANGVDTTTKAREQGVALAREMLDAARGIPYSQLSNQTIVSKLQAMPSLGNANVGPGWTIVRRSVVYTVAAGTCAVDDAADGYGNEDPNQFCADPTGAARSSGTSCNQLLSAGITGSAGLLGTLNGSLAGQLSIGDCGIDANLDGRIDDLTQADVSLCLGSCLQPTPITDPRPDDYKRIEVNVTWAVGNGTRHVLLATTVTNPGLAAGPHIVSLTDNTTPALPVGLVGVTTIPFTATTDPLGNATAVTWSVNGAPQGSALQGASNSWTFAWNIGVSPSPPLPSTGEVLDGNYSVAATAYDKNGDPGPPYSMTIALNRRQPYAPTNFAGGHDGSIVDFIWSPNREGDIGGYRVYRVNVAPPNTLVCSTGNVHSTTCSDNPPAGATLIQYYVVALDKDTSGNVREGDHSATLNVTTSNQVPNPPTNLQASTSNGNTVLAWTYPANATCAPLALNCSSSTPDADGESIDFFRIYRDGQQIANRYDTAPGNATTYTDTQTGGVPHTYWVTAVDPQLAESTAAGPVTR